MRLNFITKLLIIKTKNNTILIIINIYIKRAYFKIVCKKDLIAKNTAIII